MDFLPETVAKAALQNRFLFLPKGLCEQIGMYEEAKRAAKQGRNQGGEEAIASLGKKGMPQ